MRVTDRMIFDNAALYTGKARDALSEASVEASTGIRVQHPGDDPSAAGQLVSHRIARERLSAMAGAARRGADELNAADGALQGVNNVLSRARELAVQLANDSASPSDRKTGALEAQSLLAQAVQSLNTKFGEHYLFAGNKDDKPPFDASGNYAGDAGQHQIEVAPGVFQPMNVRADVAIKGVGGGVDVMGTLSALATALQNNDVPGIQSAIDGVSRATDQVSAARAQAGVSVHAMDAAVSANQAARDGESKQISNLGDADQIASATRLQLSQRALEASISASAKTFDLSLSLLRKLQ